MRADCFPIGDSVLAYPQGPVAQTAARSHRRYLGSLGISHDRGSARTDGGARLWGFIGRQDCGWGDRRRRIDVHGRTSAQTAGGFAGTERLSPLIGIANSVSAASSAHTQSLPGRTDPVKMSSRHSRTAHELSHDVSLGFGELG